MKGVFKLPRARRVNPVIFSKNLCIGKSKALPSKKHKCNYHLCLEEAAADLIIDEDSTYLKRIIMDMNENDVIINNFRSLSVDCSIANTTMTAHLCVNRNVVTVKITVPRYSLSFIITPDEIISQEGYIKSAIWEKIKGVFKSLKEIYGSNQIC